MRPNPNHGRVYRRCGCRDMDGRQLGAHCPRLTNPPHGSWEFAVDLPSPDRTRKTMRHSGYATRSAARAALAKVLECERTGVQLDDTQSVADYLTGWLESKARTLKPTTVALPRLSPQRSPASLRRDPARAPPSPTRRPVHPHRAGRQPWPGHSSPLHLHPVQRTQRRDSPTPTRPQRRPLRRRPRTAEDRTSMLEHRAGRGLPTPLPPDRRPTLRTVRTADLHRPLQHRDRAPDLPSSPLTDRATRTGGRLRPTHPTGIPDRSCQARPIADQRFDPRHGIQIRATGSALVQTRVR